MDRKQLEKIKSRFTDYAAGFYGDDKFVNSNIKMKENHSRRTAAEMVLIARAIGLDESGSYLAEVIGLLHDIGRFRQFSEYRTYTDNKSVNHSLLGSEILHDGDMIADLPDRERELIELAVKCHGARDLPENVNGESLMFCKMVRDADKLDIYEVVLDFYAKYMRGEQDYEIETDLLDLPDKYSPEVVEMVISGQPIDYDLMKCWNDIKLLQLGWVHDINFNFSLKQIKERDYLPQILNYLPDTPEIRIVGEKVFEYVDRRISGEGKEF